MILFVKQSDPGCKGNLKTTLHNFLISAFFGLFHLNFNVRCLERKRTECPNKCSTNSWGHYHNNNPNCAKSMKFGSDVHEDVTQDVTPRQSNNSQIQSYNISINCKFYLLSEKYKNHMLKINRKTPLGQNRPRGTLYKVNDEVFQI